MQPDNDMFAGAWAKAINESGISIDDGRGHVVDHADEHDVDQSVDE
jgi:hypothetical protein